MRFWHIILSSFARMRLIFCCALLSVLDLSARAVEALRSGKYLIKSVHKGTFLRAAWCNSHMDSTHIDLAPHARNCEEWILKTVRNEHFVSFFSLTLLMAWKFFKIEQIVCSDLPADGVSTAQVGDVGAMSVGLSKRDHLWRPTEYSDGSWTLQCLDGKYLAVDDDGQVYRDFDDEGNEMRFGLIGFSDSTETRD